MSDKDLEPGRERCGAQSRTGGTCKLPAGHGTDHVGIGRCKLHGGSTPNHRANAELIKAVQAVELWGGRKDIHPAEALLELVQWKAAEVEYWRRQVASLEESDLTWGVTEATEMVGGEGGGFDSTKREAKPHIALVLLRNAEQDLANYASAALKAGVDAALVRVAEVQASRLVAAMDRLLADPRVTVEGDVRGVVLDALQGLGQP